MSARSKSTRHPSPRGPAGRRPMIHPGNLPQFDTPERIARQVMDMTPAEVEEFISSRGLTHLTDPDRIEAILNMASDEIEEHESENGEEEAEIRREAGLDNEDGDQPDRRDTSADC